MKCWKIVIKPFTLTIGKPIPWQTFDKTKTRPVGAVCKRCSLQAIIDKREKKIWKKLLQPISKEILKAELSEDKRLRFTNKSHNEIYVITYQDSPNVMKEIGRLREIAFVLQVAEQERRWISMNMTWWKIHGAIIVWNPEAEEIWEVIVIFGDEVPIDEHGKPVAGYCSHV